MANKAISQLNAAYSVESTDLFVLEQDGAAKKLTGQILMNNLATALAGHGGISTIAKTSSSDLTDIYTITYADGHTTNFTVKNGDGITNITSSTTTVGDRTDTVVTVTTNTGSYNFTVQGGVKGETGEADHVYIMFSADEPTSDSDMKPTPDAWMGIAITTASSAPSHYRDYTWIRVRGEDGQDGSDGQDGRDGQDGAPGAQGEQGEQGVAGARAWLATGAPIPADTSYVFTPSQISIPFGVSAEPQIGDMIWWQNNYYYITSIAYSNNQVNAYGCALGYSIVPGGYINMVYYADYGIDYSGRLQDAWEGGKALFCVMPQQQQDDPQNILALTNVTENYQGGSGDTPHTRFIFSAVHHTSNGNVLEVAISGGSAINSWSTATYSLSGGGGVADVIYVNSSSTYAEVDAAVSVHKLVIYVDNDGEYYYYSHEDTSNHSYVFVAPIETGLVSISIDDLDRWSSVSFKRIPSLQSSGTPAALGDADRGSSSEAARADHVHQKPSASDIGAVAVVQGAGNAGKFLVVGNDGNVTTVTMTAWAGGNY